MNALISISQGSGMVLSAVTRFQGGNLMIRIFILVAILLCVQGCTSKPTPILDDQIPTLGENEGLVLLKINNPYAAEYIQSNGSSKYKIGFDELRMFARDMRVSSPTGAYFLFSLKAGSYRFERIQRYINNTKYYVTFPKKISESQWSYQVEAGKINYIGDLVLEVGPSNQFRDIYLMNRSAIAFSFVEKRFPNILEAYPMTFGGVGRDGVFEELQQ
ncbi:hypothetical protein KUV89_07975 [Marinobacter hydrocarbonoclasticus]|nr:hypothetical protein [Marinobacter nauticus]